MRVPITFRLKLPGTSLGEFKNAPKINDGARLIYPNVLKASKGTIKDKVITTPLKKCELFTNNSSFVSLLFVI